MMGNIHKSCFIESKNPYGYFFPWPSIKTEGIFAATRMDLEIIIVSKLDQTKTKTIRYCLSVESLKNGTSELR